MEHQYRNYQLIMAFRLALFIGAILTCSTSFAQSVAGPTNALEPCNTYQYTASVPSYAQNVTYDWLYSTGAESITYSNSASANIRWKNEPDSSTPKKAACRIKYSYTRIDSNGNPYTAYYDGIPAITVTVKYLAPVGAISINGVAVQTSYSLSCGSSPITVSVAPLTTEPVSSVTYTWDIPSTWAISSGANTSSVTVTPDVSTGGKITVTAKRSDGTCTTSRSVNITRPLPTRPLISGVPPKGLLCDKSALLTVTAQNATSYVWEATGVMRVNGQTSIAVDATTSSITVSAVASGTGTVKVRAFSKTCNVYSPYSNEFLLKYDVPPVYQTDEQGTKVIAVDETQTLVKEYSPYPVSSSSSGLKLKVFASDATDMTWKLINSNGSIASLAYPTRTTFDNFVYLNGSTTGDFRIEATIRNCFNRSQAGNFIFYIVSGGTYSALAYPNPTSDELTVQFDAATAEDNLPDKIELYNDQQKLVRSLKVKDNAKEKAVKIDVRSLPKGTYFLHIIDPENPDKDKRIVRQKISIE